MLHHGCERLILRNLLYRRVEWVAAYKLLWYAGSGFNLR
jgi:hypothetical protein